MNKLDNAEKELNKKFKKQLETKKYNDSFRKIICLETVSSPFSTPAGDTGSSSRIKRGMGCR